MTTYYFICEGKSEFAYIQLLNRFLHAESVPIYFKAYDAKGGKPNNIKLCFKHIKQHHRDAREVYAFLDLDIYFREDEDILALPDNVIYLFNNWNFEDFLVLHYDGDIVSTWHSSCCTSGHAQTPEHSSAIVSRIRNDIFPGYTKGEFPDGFKIDWDAIHKLFKNNGKCKYFLLSDFVYFLKCLLTPYRHHGC